VVPVVAVVEMIGPTLVEARPPLPQHLCQPLSLPRLCRRLLLQE